MNEEAQDGPRATDAADAAIAEGAAKPEPPPPIQPLDAGWTPDTEPRPETAHEKPDEGVLDSLGRAVSAPIRDAAAPDEAAQTGRPPPP